MLAAWALALRWQQYGLSLDRLWAALSIGVASVYALGYARAATRRSNPWLHGIAPVNRLASALMATALVLTHTPLLDFRAITARALQARGDTLNDDDLRYLRWQLGQPGLTALHAVQQQRQASNPDSAAAIARLLSQTSRWQDHEAADAPPKAPLTYRHPPNHPAVPAGLPAALAAHAVTGWSGDALEPDGAPEYWLFSLALDAHDPPEWLRLTLPLKADGHERVWLEVFRADASGAWRRIRTEDFWRDDIPALRQSLQDGHFAAQPRDLLDVRIGTQTLRFSKPD